MKTISKVILHNFRRFTELEIDFNPTMNILIGDNESGKSSVLLAIDLLSCGSRYKVEEIGLEKLFNTQVINEYMQGDRKIENLPKLEIEIYFPEQNNEFLFGRNNSKQIESDGLRMQCKPMTEYSEQTQRALSNQNASFPFEFYGIYFETFAGHLYNGYTKQLRSIFIDHTKNYSTYSMSEYIKTLYHSKLNIQQRIDIQQQYHAHKDEFAKNILSQFNDNENNYAFSIKNSPNCNIETDLTIIADGITIDNKGMGMQCFIKTTLSLSKVDDNIDIVLLEEPESHLSYTNMLKLISLIDSATNRQIFMATHSDLIASRLDLRNCILLNSNSKNHSTLGMISEDTAKFFIKAPDKNLLQFILSEKVILVEGDAEYILMEAMYKNTTTKDLIDAGISVIAVDGKCFKRYLEIAKILRIKVAVITDNDYKYDENITNRYAEYMTTECSNIKVFADSNNENHTFEVCLYKENKKICDDLFKSPRRTLEVLEYMLSNKAEVAYNLLSSKANELITPHYIKEAILWVNA